MMHDLTGVIPKGCIAKFVSTEMYNYSTINILFSNKVLCVWLNEDKRKRGFTNAFQTLVGKALFEWNKWIQCKGLAGMALYTSRNGVQVPRPLPRRSTERASNVAIAQNNSETSSVHDSCQRDLTKELDRNWSPATEAEKVKSCFAWAGLWK